MIKVELTEEQYEDLKQLIGYALDQLLKRTELENEIRHKSFALIRILTEAKRKSLEGPTS